MPAGYCPLPRAQTISLRLSYLSTALCSNLPKVPLNQAKNRVFSGFGETLSLARRLLIPRAAGSIGTGKRSVPDDKFCHFGMWWTRKP